MHHRRRDSVIVIKELGKKSRDVCPSLISCFGEGCSAIKATTGYLFKEVEVVL